MTNYVLAKEKDGGGYLLHEVGLGGEIDVENSLTAPGKNLEDFGDFCEEKGVKFAERDLLICSSALGHGLPVTGKELRWFRRRLAA